MTADQFISILAAITLIEMMFTTGLGVRFREALRVSKNWRLISRAEVANYIFVPCAAIGLLRLFHIAPRLFHIAPMISAGFLIVAVCPGARYGPPFSFMAKGNVSLAVGLMVILAASCAIIAPILLRVLLRFVAGGTASEIDVSRMVITLLGAQLLPLCLGLWVSDQRPGVASICQRLAGRLSLALNLILLTSILISQFRFLAQIHARGYLGMLLLLIATMAASGVLSGGGEESLKAMVLTTAVLGMSASHWWSRPLAFQEQPLLPQQQRMAYFKQLLWR